jgi:hypothetical protein
MIFSVLLACTMEKQPSEQVDTDETEIAARETDVTVEDVGADVEFSSASDCAECHPSHYAEWQQSMHAYAAHSPVFDAMAMKAFRDTSGEVGTFCTGCHSPIGTIYGEDGTTTASERSDISLDSVSCEVCHSSVDHSSPIGNLSLYFTSTGEKYGPHGSQEVEGHTSVQSDFVSSPVLCGSCHDVFNFPGLRIEEAFSEYVISPAASEGIRCQDCHMGPIPGVVSSREVGPIAFVEGKEYPDRERSNHRFIGPDYSLIDGFPFPDDLEASELAQQEMLGQIQVLLENAVKISDVRLQRENGEFALEIDVESLVSGHNVPTGFTSERQLWVEVTVYSQQGEQIFTTGDLDTYGDIKDSHSWDVASGLIDEDEQLVNFQSKNVLRHGEVELPEIKETIFPFDADYIEKHSLRPLELRTVEYNFATIPGQLTIDVALKYRNLPPYLLRALQLDELVERLQIFTIDQVQVQL